MKTADNETLVMFAGVLVLALSLAVPLFQDLAKKHDVRQIASGAVDLKNELLSAKDPGKVLSVKVSNLVGELSPDAALAASPTGAEKSPGGQGREDAAKGDKANPKVVAEWSGAGEASVRVQKDQRARGNWAWDPTAH